MARLLRLWPVINRLNSFTNTLANSNTTHQ